MTAVEDRALATASHPLEPLTADEIAAAARLLQARSAASGRRPASCSSRCTSRRRRTCWGGPGRGPAAARGAPRGLRARRAHHLRGRGFAERALGGVVAPRRGRTGRRSWPRSSSPARRIVQADPRWQEAMRRRGVTDFSLAMVDPWASSWTGPDDDPLGRRIARPLTFVRVGAGRARLRAAGRGPDLRGRPRRDEVVDVDDHGVVPLPPQPGNYEEPWIFESGQRPAGRTRPRRRQADRDHPARGPELHRRRARRALAEVAPADRLHPARGPRAARGRLRRARPIIYRASLAEMYVPYGDPAPTHRFKNVFDQGEYGVGWLANPLTLGCDCLGRDPLLRRRRQRPRRRAGRDPERRSACTRRTRASAGSTPTSAPRRSRCGGCAGW